MQQACEPVRGGSRRGGERPRGRNGNEPLSREAQNASARRAIQGWSPWTEGETVPARGRSFRECTRGGEVDGGAIEPQERQPGNRLAVRGGSSGEAPRCRGCGAGVLGDRKVYREAHAALTAEDLEGPSVTRAGDRSVGATRPGRGRGRPNDPLRWERGRRRLHGNARKLRSLAPKTGRTSRECGLRHGRHNLGQT